MAVEVLDQQPIHEKLSRCFSNYTATTKKLRRSIEFADFLTALSFVNKIAPRCEELDHHPDLALRWRWVDVQLATHSKGGVTDLDLALAEIVDEVAASLPLAT